LRRDFNVVRTLTRRHAFGLASSARDAAAASADIELCFGKHDIDGDAGSVTMPKTGAAGRDASRSAALTWRNARLVAVFRRLTKLFNTLRQCPDCVAETSW